MDDRTGGPIVHSDNPERGWTGQSIARPVSTLEKVEGVCGGYRVSSQAKVFSFASQSMRSSTFLSKAILEAVNSIKVFCKSALAFNSRRK